MLNVLGSLLVPCFILLVSVYASVCWPVATLMVGILPLLPIILAKVRDPTGLGIFKQRPSVNFVLLLLISKIVWRFQMKKRH